MLENAPMGFETIDRTTAPEAFARSREEFREGWRCEHCGLILVAEDIQVRALAARVHLDLQPGCDPQAIVVEAKENADLVLRRVGDAVRLGRVGDTVRLETTDAAGDKATIELDHDQVQALIAALHQISN